MEAQNPTENPQITRTFSKSSRELFLLLCDTRQEPNENCSEKLVQMNFLFWLVLGGWIFLLRMNKVVKFQRRTFLYLSLQSDLKHGGFKKTLRSTSEAPRSAHGFPTYNRGFAKGWFPKGWFRRMFPWNENRNEGTFAKTTLLETAPLSPNNPFWC